MGGVALESSVLCPPVRPTKWGWVDRGFRYSRSQEKTLNRDGSENTGWKSESCCQNCPDAPMFPSPQFAEAPPNPVGLQSQALGVQEGGAGGLQQGNVLMKGLAQPWA